MPTQNKTIPVGSSFTASIVGLDAFNNDVTSSTTIELVSSDSSVVRVSSTDQNGAFYVQGLKSGRAVLTWSANGVVKEINNITVSGPEAVNFVVTLGSLN